MREGNTASVTINTPPTAQGNTPIRLNKSHGLSIVVLSFNISTLASAGILTADSFGVILFKNKNTTNVTPVTTLEHAKKMPAATFVEEAVLPETRDVMGGNMPERPWPAMIAWVYRGPKRPERPNEEYWMRAVAVDPRETEKRVKM